eukprot:TRINITY_DN7853_c0_g1_i14.p1 TRINITY_DN7853_c0_g1~~TRINITY_DN7853_c0_g1_i14.p1  ORF type:complete len:330 (-),score=84.44 TRINITY_DN7853_c0_g1_i14:42-1031(-)
MMNCKLFNGRENYQKQFNEIRTIYYSCTGKSAEDVFQLKDAKFLFGDLNFRLELDQSLASIMAEQRRFQEMQKFDQLWSQYHNFNYLPKLIEHQIAFQPTYKFLKNSSKFNLKKVPSWRDRILWLKTDFIACEEYNSSNELVLSDHKPIYGVYQVRVNIKREVDPNESLGFEEVEREEGAKFTAVKGEEIKLSFKKSAVNPSRNMNALYSKDDSDVKHVTTSIDGDRKSSYDMIKFSDLDMNKSILSSFTEVEPEKTSNPLLEYKVIHNYCDSNLEDNDENKNANGSSDICHIDNSHNACYLITFNLVYSYTPIPVSYTHLTLPTICSV